MKRVLPPTLVIVLTSAMLAVQVLWMPAQLPWTVRGLGAIALMGGAAITMRHAALFDTVGTNIKTFDDPDQLVLSGAFGWSRNPMYLGFFTFLLGLALLLGSAVAFIGPVIFFVAADRWYIPFEERRLLATFGDDYLQYQQRVRRWAGRTS